MMKGAGKGNVLMFLVVLLSDQFTKLLALQYLKPGEEHPIIADLFNLTLVFNPGAAFGMFGGLPDPWRHITLATVSLLAVGVVFWFMFTESKDDRLAQAALSAILAGALGNIVDRFRFDAVVDFLDFYWGRYHWPAFNIADSAISLGVAVLLIRFLFRSEKSSSRGAEQWVNAEKAVSSQRPE